jgi:glycoprotease/Kae1 family metallohydrolase
MRAWRISTVLGRARTIYTHPRPTTVLALETSCDDTAVAIVSSDRTIHYSVVKTQDDLYEAYSGVKPDAAARAHASVLGQEVSLAWQQWTHQHPSTPISAVAVTQGPGLGLCLAVGMEQAKRVSRARQIPLVPVHHLDAHLLMPRLTAPGLAFPYLGLLVSGGHCLTCLTTAPQSHRILGETKDDALGEAFDKVARLLGCVPATGKALEKVAAELPYLGELPDMASAEIPIPLRNAGADETGFSYAGMKTAMLRRVCSMLGLDSRQIRLSELRPTLTTPQRAVLADAFQRAAIAHTVQQLRRTIVKAKSEDSDCSGVRHLVVSGGVASNAALRSAVMQLCSDLGLEAVFPPVQYCTDNAVMVGWAALEGLKAGRSGLDPLRDQAAWDALDIRPRWSLRQLLQEQEQEQPTAVTDS